MTPFIHLFHRPNQAKRFTNYSPVSSEERQTPKRRENSESNTAYMMKGMYMAGQEPAPTPTDPQPQDPAPTPPAEPTPAPTPDPAPQPPAEPTGGAKGVPDDAQKMQRMISEAVEKALGGLLPADPKPTEPVRLTTSQNVTAPKRSSYCDCSSSGLTTSQNVTAPKHGSVSLKNSYGLTTSQNVTAPKPRIDPAPASWCLTTSQNVTAPKL